MAERLRVLITDPVWTSIDIERRILEPLGAEVVMAPARDAATLAGIIGDYDGVLTNFGELTRPVLQAARRCKIVARYGIGYDNVDVRTATEEGILVTNVTGYCPDELAEHAIGLLFACARKIALLNRNIKRGEWDRTKAIPVHNIHGRTLGLIGYGSSARALAWRARGLGMRLLVYTRHPDLDELAKWEARAVDLPTLLAESDFVSLHVPLAAGTNHLIGEAQLRQMKPGAFLINVARGPLVDERALYKALTQGWIAGAGVDVMEKEPPDPDNPLLPLDNFVVTSHAAFYSEESVARLQELATQQVAMVLRGERPTFAVNPEVLSGPRWRAAVGAREERG
ncbi:MAG: C-terminal binding protein [Chloroflexi bacterium]|nr:C-terminal binding protein [Chloroflexota bacterium]MCL5025322.1 C-terminal binding protein [Chloroflexota bacterium]